MTEEQHRLNCAWGSLHLRLAIERMLGVDGSVATMQAQIASSFGIELHDLLGRSRRASYVLPRQTAMYLARKKGWSWPYIGRRFGRDHTTAIHAFKATAQRMARDPEYAAKVEALRERLG